jgi:hypothetical protein
MPQHDDSPAEPYGLDRIAHIAPEELYGEENAPRDMDDIDDRRFVVYELPYEPIDGEETGVLEADEIKYILETGADSGKTFPLFKSLEMSTAFIERYRDETDGVLVTSKIENGEPSDLGYFINDRELVQLVNFDQERYVRE